MPVETVGARTSIKLPVREYVAGSGFEPYHEAWATVDEPGVGAALPPAPAQVEGLVARLSRRSPHGPPSFLRDGDAAEAETPPYHQVVRGDRLTPRLLHPQRNQTSMIRRVIRHLVRHVRQRHSG